MFNNMNMNMNVNNSISTDASDIIEENIIKTVKNQHIQFDELSKQFENDRKLISNKLEQYIISSSSSSPLINNQQQAQQAHQLDDVVSIPSITSTNDDRFIWINNNNNNNNTNQYSIISEEEQYDEYDEHDNNNNNNNNNNDNNLLLNNNNNDEDDDNYIYNNNNNNNNANNSNSYIISDHDNQFIINNNNNNNYNNYNIDNNYYDGDDDDDNDNNNDDNYLLINKPKYNSINNNNNNCDIDIDRSDYSSKQNNIFLNMVDNNNSSTQQQQQPPPQQPSSTSSQHHSNGNLNENGNYRNTDHYSYSYTYKNGDDNGIPGVSSVEVNESITEEIGPDGSKIIRRHQQEKQINKVTQIVTQKIIKRQYIDPVTGKIIEYDPNDERFANLPPETVFEEHTIRSNETPSPINPNATTTTTTIRKYMPQVINGATTTTNTNGKTTTNGHQYHQNGGTKLHGHKITDLDLTDGTSLATGLILQSLDKQGIRKSHPEDNQGYPEERNMDYDPDDVNYPEDPQYEGLIPDSMGGLGIGGGGGGGDGGSLSSQSPQLTSTKQRKTHKTNQQLQQQQPSISTSTIIKPSPNNNTNINNIYSTAITDQLQPPYGTSQTILNQNVEYGITPNYNDPRYATIGHQQKQQQQQLQQFSQHRQSPNDLGYGTSTFNVHDPIYDSGSRYSSIQAYDIYDATTSRPYSQQQQQVPNSFYQQIPTQMLSYNDNSNYGSFQPINGYQQRNIISRNQQYPQQTLLRTRSPSNDSRREQGWRNPMLEEVIEYLSHPSNEIKSNAAAYLQHLCYQDDDTKTRTRLLGGIKKLIVLLSNEKVDVHRNACGALRNLSYGRTNDENKLEICNNGGIKALIDLLKRTNDDTVKEAVTAVLWNLSSSEDIKSTIIGDGLYALVRHVLLPYSTIEAIHEHQMVMRTSQMNLDQSKRSFIDYSSYPTVLTNCSGVLRNCSSNLQFSTCYEARKKLRECDGLIPALLRIINFAVEPFMKSSSSSNNNNNNQPQVQIDQLMQLNIDSKCVENCMCILRNLSFRLQEIIDPNYDRDVKPMPLDDPQYEHKKSKWSSKKLKSIEEDFLKNTYPYNMKAPEEGKSQELLWNLDTVAKYLVIIKESTIRDTIEASVGCVQNLTACYWKPSMMIRQEIRKLRGLPTIVFLLQSDKIEDEPVVSVTAIALRNLAIDSKNRELIGKYAMKDLVSKLPDPNRPIPKYTVLNEDTITAALACINECIKSSDEFVRSCYNENGVTRMIYVTRNAEKFPPKIVKYAAHVLFSMWKHKGLHDFLRKDGFKENDYTITAKQMGIKSHSSSPANTLVRPRGDVNVKPSLHGSVGHKSKNKNKQQQQSQQNNTTNGISNSTKSINSNQNQMNEDMPIYSQVQKNNNNNTNNLVNGSNSSNNNNQNRNLIITNGSTNADSWV